MPEFNQQLYKTSLDVLLSANVPKDVAEVASRVVASDDAKLPNLGRTPVDQEFIDKAIQHYWAGQGDANS
ncbi:hypothetical protein I8752_29300 [Nostocaceae cyanobacterium CENA369]|uniref:Uncharacterized protein n=1 Tax=Dendronalium phyllosphericum CENA369 TaxID=1725256 RepID=A0A8J7INR9_9NOST|nr:hypothetical protein [Dendronalium phyllosphericum]MBH8577007.1 hypothetical protein [Dendronalium phyllosphericum CENA369]